MQNSNLSKQDTMLMDDISKQHDVAGARKIVHWGRTLSWVIVGIIVIDFIWESVTYFV